MKQTKKKRRSKNHTMLLMNQCVALPTFAILIIFLAMSRSPWWFCPISAMMKHGWFPPIFRPGHSSNSSGILLTHTRRPNGRKRRREAVEERLSSPAGSGGLRQRLVHCMRKSYSAGLTSGLVRRHPLCFSFQSKILVLKSVAKCSLGSDIIIKVWLVQSLEKVPVQDVVVVGNSQPLL